MKTFRFIGMALFAVLMCVNFVACGGSDEEDEPEAATIVGTWKYSSNYDGNGIFTFKSNGGLVWDDGEETSSNHTYTLNGSELKIIFNNNDDYTLGSFTMNGKNATYKYHWYDCGSNEKQTSSECTMTLTKQ